MDNNLKFNGAEKVEVAEPEEEKKKKKIILLLLLLLLLLFFILLMCGISCRSKKPTATLGIKDENPNYVNTTPSPEISDKKGEIAILPSTTNWTNENILVSVSYTGNIKGAKKLISIDNGETFEEYVAPVEISNNTKVVARLEDEDNEIILEESLLIGNIDKLAPKEFNITVQTSKQTVLIKAYTEDAETTNENGKSEIKEYEYIIKKGEWKKEITSKENICAFNNLQAGEEYKVQVSAIDNAGNRTTSEEVNVEVKALSKLTVNPNGGIWEGSGNIKEIEQKGGTTINIPAPTRVGYTFKGWTISNSGKTVDDVYTYVEANETIIAKWEINQYTLTFNANGGEVSTNSIKTNYNEGITLPIPTVNNYTISYNTDGGNTITSENVKDTFTGWYTDIMSGEKREYANMPAGDETLYAHWDKANVILPLPVKPGYKFNGWYSDNTYSSKVGNAGEVYIPAGNITLYAKWEISQYTINFEANGGTVTPSSVVKNYGESVTLPSPTREGHTFEGWYSDYTYSSKVGNAGDEYTATENITLYAKWNINKYTLTLDPNGGTVGVGVPDDPQTITADFGAEITMPIPTRTHMVSFNTNGGNAIPNKTSIYTFMGWYTDALGGEERKYLNIPAVNETLYAHWDNTSVKITLPNPTKLGCTFEGWYADEALTTKVGNVGEEYIPTSDVTLYAKWNVNQYTLTLNPNGGIVGGGVPDDPQTITADFGANITMPVPSKEYTVKFDTDSDNTLADETVTYTFEGWYTSAVGGEKKEYTTMPAANENLYAHWDNTSAKITLPSITVTGYTFNGWYADEALTTKIGNAGDEYIPTSDITLYAKWSINQYTLTLEPNGGEISTNTITEDYGETITLPTPTKEYTLSFNTNGGDAISNETLAYTFAGWYTDASAGEQRAYTTMPEINETLYAHWDNASGEITLPTPTKTGYTFAGWYKDNSYAEKIGNAGDEYTPTENVTIYAKWEINERTLTFDANGGEISTNTITADFGEAITMPIPTKEYTLSFNTNGGDTISNETLAYTFTGWYTDASAGEQRTYTTMPEINETLYAHWDNTSAKIALPTPTKTGATFDGWYSDGALTEKIGNAGDEYTPTENITIYAKWESNQYTLTFDANEGELSTNSITEYYGVDITMPTPSREYTVSFNTDGGNAISNETVTYTFDGWYTSAEGGDKKEYTTMPAADENLYAHWDNTSGEITLPTPTKTGYEFAGWYEDSTLTTKVGDNGEKYKPTNNVTLYVSWKVNPYTLTFDATGGTLDSTTIKEEYGKDITLPTPSREYTVSFDTTGGDAISNETVTYTFDGWYTSAEGGNKKEYTTMPAGDETLYAHWNNTGISITMPTPTKTGYTFEGWYKDNSYAEKIGNAGDEYTPTEDITLYAKWSINQYTLTLDANGGTNIDPEEITADFGAEITMPTPTRTHTVSYNTDGGDSISNETVTYTFDGWYTSAEGGDKKAYTTMPAGDENLYAHWNNTSASITLPTPTKIGYTFDGWYKDEALTTKIGNVGEIYTPTEDITLYAKWNINQYTLTLDPNGGTVGADLGEITADFGAEITMPTPTREYVISFYTDCSTTITDTNMEYTFEGWYTSAEAGEQKAYTTMPSADETLYAHWDNTSAKLILPSLSETGYTFEGWYKDEALTTKIGNAGDAYIPTEDITLYAKWSINQYTLTLDANGGQIATNTITADFGETITMPSPTKEYTVSFDTTGGSAIPDETATCTFSGWYTSAEGGEEKAYTTMPSADENLYAHWDNTSANITLPSATKTGYTIEGWYSDAELTTKVGNAGEAYIPTEDITLYAKWNVNQYTLTFNANGGEISTNTITEDYGTEITLPTPTKVNTVSFDTTGGDTMSDIVSNYTFVGWYTSAEGGDQKEYTTMPSADETLYAHWDNTTTKITLPTPTKTGYTFTGWYEDSTFATKAGDAGDYYTPSGDMTLYATWQIAEYTVTFNATGGTVTPASVTQEYNTSTSLPTATKEGYKLAGWYNNISCEDINKVGNAGENYTILGDTTLYAKWDKLGIYVKLYSDGELVFTDTDRVLEEKTSAGITVTNSYGDIKEVQFASMSAQLWRNEDLSITSVDIVDKIQPTYTGYWFKKFNNTTAINNIANLDTSKVVNMEEMFNGCSSLTSIDLSNFDTSSVTNMDFMFYKCSSLTQLDLSKFNTSNVTNMSAMFEGCSSLTSLDLSNFDTTKVTSMAGIFTNCTSLTQITFGDKWNKEVTLPTPVKTDYSFTGWYSDAEFTNKVADVGANYTPSGAVTIYAGFVPNIYVKLYTEGTLAFTATDRLLTGKTLSQDYGNINGKEFTAATQPWKNELSSITSVDIVDEIMPISTAYWFENCTNLTTINNIANLNTNKVTNMVEMFVGCTSLTELDLRSFNTENVTDMSAMFATCTGLQNINLSSFNTSNVTNMRSMFYRCESLTQLDLSSFDTSKVSNISDVFSTVFGSKLTQITFGDKWNKEVTLPTPVKGNYTCTAWYSDAEFTNKVAEAGANYTPTGPITIYANVPPDIFVTLYTDGTLGFCSNNSKIEGKEVSQEYGDISTKIFDKSTQVLWYGQRGDITTVEFVNEIAPISTAYWFWGIQNLTTLNNIENLNTVNVTNMLSMFNSCTKLTSLNVSNFDTSNVINMGSMFTSCRSLTSLDVSNFDTSNVTNMASMFEMCTNLTQIDLSNFNTSNVVNMTTMFSECSKLTSLDLSSFDTSNVTNITSLFYNCTSLEQITFGDKWNKEVTLPTPVKTDYNFTGWYNDADCTNKVAEGGANYTPSGAVTLYAGMAPNIYVKLYTDGTLAFTATDRLLTGKTLSKSYGNIYGQEFTFATQPWRNELARITSVNIVDEIIPTSTAYWFGHCDNLVTLNNIQNLNTKNVTDMNRMFLACNSLTSLDLSSFNTNNVTNMDYMFNAFNITNINVGNFNTSNVISMEGMFSQCYNLTQLDLSSFDTSKVTNITDIFVGSTSLEQITFGDKWNKEVTLPTPVKENYTCSGWYSDSTYTTKVADAGANYTPSGAVTIYAGMVSTHIYAKLYDDGTLAFTATDKTIEEKNIYNDFGDIINNTDGFLDTYANEVKSVDIVDIIYPVSTAKWFFECRNLTTINNIANLGTHSVTDMNNMFYCCSSLISLDLSTFNTSKVTDMSWMFAYCSRLDNVNLSSFNTEEVTNMSSMFNDCQKLTSLNVNTFNTSKVTDMSYMLYGLSKLTSLDVSNFDTSNVTNMKYMFNGAINLTSLDVSNFDTSKVTDMRSMFGYCTNLTTIYVGDKWSTSKADTTDMFKNCGTSSVTRK